MHKNIKILKVSFPNVVTIGGPWVNFSMGIQYVSDQLRLFVCKLIKLKLNIFFNLIIIDYVRKSSSSDSKNC